VLEESGGEVVIVAVINGKRGNGISHQAKMRRDVDPIDFMMAQAQAFREAADQLQAEVRRARQQKRGN
jgi:hypothetical protein